MPATAEPTSPLSKLHPRKTLGETEINALLADIRAELQAATALEYWDRMELNHDTRMAWWEGQTNDGRKWSSRERSGRWLPPGVTPARDVFPWDGSSDVRVRLVETVIREHNTFKRLAVARRQQRIGARNLGPDEEPQAKAALWGQVDDYYADTTRASFARETARWADIAHEYGHGVLFVGWRAELGTEPKTITADVVSQAVQQAAVELAQETAAALWEAEGGEGTAPELTAEEQLIIAENAAAGLADMILDDKQRGVLAAKLMELDPDMPKDEAARVARSLRAGKEVEYYAITVAEQKPVFRALTFGIDVFFPALTETLEEAEWVVMPEWISDVKLCNRINNPKEPYDEAWVESVLEHPGKAFDLGQVSGSAASWLFSGGHVRCGVATDDLDKANRRRFQILHVYYRASAVGNVEALYHTVLHPSVPGLAGHHECCEHYHGRMPFFEHVTDLKAAYILAAEGYGEQSFTDQGEVKTQRDARSDNASLQIKPPLEVPFNQSKKVPWRPGAQIPVRSTAGMGVIKPMNPGTDARSAQEIDAATRDSFNEYWCRGDKVDPEVKTGYRQLLVNEFLGVLAEAKKCVFKLIQQFAPAELRASFAGGLPVNLNVTREEIQGEVAMELDYDVTELDPDRAEKTVKSLGLVRQMDPQNLLQYDKLLKGVVSYLMPAHYKTLVAAPDARAKEETKDEQEIVGSILAGTQFDEEGSYVAGTNHGLRLDVMKKIFGVEVDKGGKIIGQMPNGANGQPSRAQRLLQEDADVQGRIANRLAFHARQVQQQQENAQVGRQLVRPVTEE